MMLDVLLTIIYIGSSVYAVVQGHRRFWIVIALMLALTFQYVLGFSELAKIIVAVIFVLYFALSGSSLLGANQVHAPLGGDRDEPSPREQSFSQAPNSTSGGRSQDSVFEEFQEFTKSQNASQENQGATDGQSNTKHQAQKR